MNFFFQFINKCVMSAATFIYPWTTEPVTMPKLLGASMFEQSPLFEAVHTAPNREKNGRYQFIKGFVFSNLDDVSFEFRRRKMVESFAPELHLRNSYEILRHSGRMVDWEYMFKNDMKFMRNSVEREEDFHRNMRDIACFAIYYHMIYSGTKMPVLFFNQYVDLLWRCREYSICVF